MKSAFDAMPGLIFSSTPPLPAQPHPETMFHLLFALMFGLGVYLFFKGFKVYWEARVLKNLPVSTIRGLAMGLVRVRGRAAGTEFLTSPVTRERCYFYRLRIEKWETDSRNRQYWLLWMRDSDQVSFHLQDETGSVLLNPRGAELELEQSFRETIEGELPDSIFTSSRRSGSPESGPGVNSAEGAEAANERNQLELIGSLARGGTKRESGRFRLTEHCIKPDNSYEVTGTCAPNPLAKDNTDRNQIKRGTGNSIFVITDKESLERTLDLRAVASIWGGAFLAVLSAALMLILYRTS